MKTINNTIGNSALALQNRSANDYYGTDPVMTQALLNAEKFNNNIWEPAAGQHLIVNELLNEGYTVKSTDLIDYGFNDDIVNFLSCKGKFNGDIITNPPYMLANDFVTKALDLVENGNKVAMLLRTLFLEGQTRYNDIFSKYPPKTVYIFSKRHVCSKNNDFTEPSAISYAWFVWEKGYTGETILKWLTD